MNQNEETETVTVMRECTWCQGTGRTCDVCDWNKREFGVVEDCRGGNHERDTKCNCFDGQVEVEVEMPKSVVEQYYND